MGNSDTKINSLTACILPLLTGEEGLFPARFTTQAIMNFNYPVFKNKVGKGEIAFLQEFSNHVETFLPFLSNL